MYKQELMSQLNATFGSGGMSCSFTDSQLASFIHFLQYQCLVKEAAMVIGRLPGDVWVINPTTKNNIYGQMIAHTMFA